MPQGSVLGPILFLIFINDLETGVMSWILKFADDTKIYRRITCDEDRLQLQRDLDTLGAWAEEWLMMFNERNVSPCTLDVGIVNTCTPSADTRLRTSTPNETWV